MILPFFPFLIINVPDMSVTDSPPIVFRIPDTSSDAMLDQFEICIDTVEYVDIGFDEYEGRPRLNISLNEAGSERLAAITTRYVNHDSQIVVGGNVLVSPRIMEPLLSDGLQISGIDTIAQAEQLRQAARGRCTIPKATAE
ncbi:MAG: hypothetical protein AAGE86_05455 [Pseudomonadota bacterium]